MLFRSADGNAIINLSYVFPANTNDKYELWWSGSTTGVYIQATGAGVSPVTPACDSVVVAVGSLAQIGVGYYNLTSLTSMTVGTGSQTFTTNLATTGTAFAVGSRVRIAYTSVPADFMEGVVTAFSGTSMTVNVDIAGGSGTWATWNISIAGNPSNTTANAVTFNNGGSGAASGTTFDGSTARTISYNTIGAQPVAAPVTKTADFTVAATDVWLINNKSGSTCTVTLPTASSSTGRGLHLQNYQAYTVISASSNVVPLVGGAASTAILNADRKSTRLNSSHVKRSRMPSSA